MRLVPIVVTFAIALLGAVALGLRPGYSFAMLLIGATLVSAMAGMAASVLQFLPKRYFVPVAVVAGIVLGLLVAPALNSAGTIGFGGVRGAASFAWPVAAVVGLLLSRESSMGLPTLRRPRAGVTRS